MKYLPLLLLAGCAPVPAPPIQTPEEHALEMQCAERHGLLATARGDKYIWYTCYQGKKKLWSVRL